MPIDFESLLQPISQDLPAGKDCHLDPDYTSIFNEIDKLTRAKDVGSPDWNKIELLSCRILKDQSKDFMVAGWLCSAWLERQGIDGIAASFGLLNGLFDKYWDTAFPPLNRIRGRRNAIGWWVDRASNFLSTSTIEPVSQEVFNCLSQGVLELDKHLADKDPDAPSLGDFIRSIKSIAIAGPTPLPSQQVSSTEDAKISSDISKSDVEGNPNSTEQKTAIALNRPDSLKSISTLNTLEDVEEAITSVQPYIGDVAQVLSKLDPYNPLAIRLIRFAARSSILSLPPATAGATLIPEPPISEIEMFHSVCAGNDPVAKIQFCESRITQYPFWLDLDYQSCVAYTSIGESAVAMQEAIIDEALSFVKRLPGIESLTFGGQKMPFADGATRSWLTDCVNKRSGDGATDSLGVAKQAATQSLNSGQGESAMEILQDYINKTCVLRDQFRARIELLQIAFNIKKGANLLPLVNPLIEECQVRNIGEWEPALALSAWRLKVRALREMNTSDAPNNDPQNLLHQQELAYALQQISVLNFIEATRQL